MNKIKQVLILGVGIILVISCSSTAPQTDVVLENQKKLTNQVKDLADEIVRLKGLQEDISQLKSQITVLDTQLVLYKNKITEYENKARVESQKTKEVKATTKDPEIINLRGNIYVLSRETEALKETVNSLVESKDSLQAKVSSLHASLEENNKAPIIIESVDKNVEPARFDAIKAETSVVKNKSPKTLTVSDYREKYSSALTLYFQNNFTPAITQFEELIAYNPKGEFADNAQYWIGECYYSMEIYDKAIDAFEKVFDFEENNKNDHAMFKIAMSYHMTGQKVKAKALMNRLLTNYPDSEMEKQAKEYLSTQ